MKLRYSGSFEVSESSGKVFDYLTDPQKFARAFPGFQSVSVEGESFTVNLKLNLGPIRGGATVKASFEEVEEGVRAKVRGTGTGAGSTLRFTLEFKVEDLGGKTRVEWAFDGDVGGLAASLGGRVLDSLARRLIGEIISNIKSGIESGSAKA